MEAIILMFSKYGVQIPESAAGDIIRQFEEQVDKQIAPGMKAGLVKSYNMAIDHCLDIVRKQRTLAVAELYIARLRMSESDLEEESHVEG